MIIIVNGPPYIGKSTLASHMHLQKFSRQVRFVDVESFGNEECSKSALKLLASQHKWCMDYIFIVTPGWVSQVDVMKIFGDITVKFILLRARDYVKIREKKITERGHTGDPGHDELYRSLAIESRFNSQYRDADFFVDDHLNIDGMVSAFKALIEKLIKS